MLGMINEAWEKQSMNYRAMEKAEVDYELDTHTTYQSLIKGFEISEQHLKEISKLERTTISKLVYELRYKRK